MSRGLQTVGEEVLSSLQCYNLELPGYSAPLTGRVCLRVTSTRRNAEPRDGETSIALMSPDYQDPAMPEPILSKFPLQEPINPLSKLSQ